MARCLADLSDRFSPEKEGPAWKSLPGLPARVRSKERLFYSFPRFWTLSVPLFPLTLFNGWFLALIEPFACYL